MLDEINSANNSIPNNYQDQQTGQNITQTQLQDSTKSIFTSYKVNALFIFGLLVFILIIILSGVYAYLKVADKNNYSDLLLNSEVAHEGSISIAPTGVKSKAYQDSFEPPLLFPEVEWGKVVSSEEHTVGKGVLYSNSTEKAWGSIDLNGDEWIASISAKNGAQMQDFLDNLDAYYLALLEQSGWKYKYKDDKYDFSPLQADGPTGEIYGYIKVNSGQLKMVLIEINRPPVASGDSLKCPCDASYSIFISNPEKMGELVKRIR